MPASALLPTYNRLPVSFTHGQGAWLWDAAGKKYLDAVAGLAVNGLGHAHPKIVRAIQEQAAKLIHVSNIYGNELQEELARVLTQKAGMEGVFFGNSGAEANECAIKLARFYGHKRGIAVPKIIVMDNAFHGRTLATLTATANKKAQEGFAPLVEGFLRVSYDDFAAIEALATIEPDIVAVLLEPVQGEGGVRAASATYLQNLRALCDQRGWLLMIDEIQTGLGRTGKLFACEHSGVTPDVMTLAKGIASGIPMGACLVRGPANGLFGPGNHGSTFGGNPLACAAALATFATIDAEGLIANAVQQGERLRANLARLLNDHGNYPIRGLGLMIGIELQRPCRELMTKALDLGLLISVTAEKVVRLLPPLILNDAESDQIAEKLAPLLREFNA